MIQEEVLNLKEEGGRAISIEFATQGTWMRWSLPKRSITWSELWWLGALPDILSTPSSVQHLTKCSQFAQVGDERGPAVQVLWQ